MIPSTDADATFIHAPFPPESGQASPASTMYYKYKAACSIYCAHSVQTTGTLCWSASAQRLRTQLCQVHQKLHAIRELPLHLKPRSGTAATEPDRKRISFTQTCVLQCTLKSVRKSNCNQLVCTTAAQECFWHTTSCGMGKGPTRHCTDRAKCLQHPRKLTRRQFPA